MTNDFNFISLRVDKIVYVSHHIPVKEFVYANDTDPIYSIFNAYQGSPKLRSITFSFDKLSLVLTGHSHRSDCKDISGVKCYNVSHKLDRLKPTIIII